MQLDLQDGRIPLDPRRAERLMEAVFAGEGRRLRVAVHVVGDACMSRLHAEHLGDAGTTDVITFDLSGEGPGEACPEDVDGEIFVNAELAAREAASRGHAPEAELLFYVAHGLLHLLGYDDDTPDRRAAMLDRQAAYLAGLGLELDG